MPAALPIMTRTLSSSPVDTGHGHWIRWSATVTLGSWKLYQDFIKEDGLTAVVVISRMGRRKVFKNLYFINNFGLKEISGGGGSQQCWFLYLLYRDLEPW